MAETLEIQLRATITDLQDKLKAAEGQVQGFSDKAGGSLQELGKMIAGVFAIEKIVSFVTTGVKEFAKFEQSMQNLRFKIEQTGVAWTGIEKDLKAYLDRTQQVTRFSDDEVVASLSILVQKTHDYSTALALNERALTLSRLTGKSLEESANELGLAYGGNSRGLMQLAKDLGVYGDKAKNGQYLMDQLTAAMNKQTREEEGLAAGLAIASNTWADFGKEVGENIAPALNFLSRSLLTVLDTVKKTSDTLFIFINGVLFVMVDTFKFLGSVAVATFELMANGIRHPLDAGKKFIGDMAKAGKTYFQNLKTDAKATSEVIVDTWTKGNTEIAKAGDDLAKKARDTKVTVMADYDEMGKFVGGKIGTELSGTFANFVKLSKDGLLTLGGIVEGLGKAMARAIIKALGETLIQEGIKNFAQGIAATMTLIGAPLAPGFFAAGAYLTGAGGVMVGVADAYLAEGGIVDKPTRAIIGESGPEAVIPLNGSTKIGGDFRVQGGMHLNFPGVRNADDVRRPRFAKSVERQLLEATQRTANRIGGGKRNII